MVTSLFKRLAKRIAARYRILNINIATILSRLTGGTCKSSYMELDAGVIPDPREYRECAKDANVEIWTFHGSTEKLRIFEVLMMEWNNTPLVNPKFFDEDMEGKTDLSHRINLVLIRNFFACGADFIYYVRGQVNMSKFMAATFSGRPYQRPMFATPVTCFDAEALFEAAGLELRHLEKASKSETKGLRWKYLFESGVRAWDELEFSWEKLAQIKARPKETGDQ